MSVCALLPEHEYLQSAVVDGRYGKFLFTSNDGEKTQIEVEDGEGIMGKIKYFVGVLSGDFENTKKCTD